MAPNICRCRMSSYGSEHAQYDYYMSKTLLSICHWVCQGRWLVVSQHHILQSMRFVIFRKILLMEVTLYFWPTRPPSWIFSSLTSFIKEFLNGIGAGSTGPDLASEQEDQEVHIKVASYSHWSIFLGLELLVKQRCGSLQLCCKYTVPCDCLTKCLVFVSHHQPPPLTKYLAQQRGCSDADWRHRRTRAAILLTTSPLVVLNVAV